MFISNWTEGVEDSSDDFFKSKHIRRRIKDLAKERKRIHLHFSESLRKTTPKLTLGLESMSSAYVINDLLDEKERLFLYLFHDLYVDDELFEDEVHCGCYLMNRTDDSKICFCKLEEIQFIVDYYAVWKRFKDDFDISDNDIESLLIKMFIKYFKLEEARTNYHTPLTFDVLKGYFKLDDITQVLWRLINRASA